MRDLASLVIGAQHPLLALYSPSSLIASKSTFCFYYIFFTFLHHRAIISHSILLVIADTRRARKPTKKVSANRVTKPRSGASTRGQRRRRSPSVPVPDPTPPPSPPPEDAIDAEQAELRRNIDNLLANERRNAETARLRAEFTRL